MMKKQGKLKFINAASRLIDSIYFPLKACIISLSWEMKKNTLSFF